MAQDAVPDAGLAQPLWIRVTEVLRADLEGMPHDAPLSSEAEQRLRFGVSRVTVRQALHQLEREGLVRPVSGRGWFVGGDIESRTARSSRPTLVASEPPGKLLSFSDLARMRGFTPGAVLLEHTVREADYDEAAALRITPGAYIIDLRRIRTFDELAVAVDRSLVPVEVAPAAATADFQTRSLHDVFRECGAGPVIAQAEVEAVVADVEFARLLETQVGMPLLKVRQALFDGSGRMVERAEMVYRSDRYRYRTRLVT